MDRGGAIRKLSVKKLLLLLLVLPVPFYFLWTYALHQQMNACFRRLRRRGALDAHHYTDVGTTLADRYGLDASGARPPFSYVINHPGMCADSARVHHVILVVTAPEDVTRRDGLRATWTRPEVVRGFPSRTIFMLGVRDGDDALQARILEEDRRHGDIIQADFTDSYHNITLKVLAGIRWVTTYCHQADYVFRANDDVFIDIFRLVDLLEHELFKRGGRQSERRSMMAGKLETKGHILRDYGLGLCQKWCVAVCDHPQLPFYPDYLQGDFFILSTDILPDLYRTALNVTAFWIEDIFLTGLCVQSMVDVAVVDLKHFYTLNFGAFAAQFDSGDIPVSHRRYFYTLPDQERIRLIWEVIRNTMPEQDKRKYIAA